MIKMSPALSVGAFSPVLPSNTGHVGLPLELHRAPARLRSARFTIRPAAAIRLLPIHFRFQLALPSLTLSHRNYFIKSAAHVTGSIKLNCCSCVADTRPMILHGGIQKGTTAEFHHGRFWMFRLWQPCSGLPKRVGRPRARAMRKL
jgi:hypothetical protein